MLKVPKKVPNKMKVTFAGTLGRLREHQIQKWESQNAILESILPNFHFSSFPILRVCSICKKYVFCTMAKLSSKKRKNSPFTKKKSLVGLAPDKYHPQPPL